MFSAHSLLDAWVLLPPNNFGKKKRNRLGSKAVQRSCCREEVTASRRQRCHSRAESVLTHLPLHLSGSLSLLLSLCLCICVFLCRGLFWRFGDSSGLFTFCFCSYEGCSCVYVGLTGLFNWCWGSLVQLKLVFIKLLFSSESEMISSLPFLASSFCLFLLRLLLLKLGQHSKRIAPNA